ncbi:hypothetical protein AURDEDRAFT_63094 [Auricularia subglabra TFB-10046 SS5]|nr:hypothetical protein AURDEDRAFT_63094 [Auricularia subglabra TFB-10046 SS5]
MFLIKALLVASFVAAQAYATPMPVAAPEELVVLATKDTSFGTLTYYGLAPGANATTPALAVARRCGSNDVTCSGYNIPSARVCASLISSLRANGGTPWPASPRSVCLSSGSTCCVSWHDPVPGLVEGYLIGAADAAFNACVVDGLSGATTNTNLNGVCTRQCLSDRATGC